MTAVPNLSTRVAAEVPRAVDDVVRLVSIPSVSSMPEHHGDVARSAAAVADQVARELPRRRLETTGDVRREDHFCVTDGSARFGRLAREILGREVGLELVDIGAGEGH